MRPIHGDLGEGVARTTDAGGLAPDLLAAIDAAGGLWHAGDFYARPPQIVAAARAKQVRALRLDARDLGLLRELPDLEFLHLRSDGRPPLDPVASLPNLRALIVETGALRGTFDLAAHPRLEWLKLKLSGRGGRENLDAVLAGHPNVRDLRLNEVPFRDLASLAAAFPAARHVRLFGADRLRDLGDLAPWRSTLEGFGSVWAPLRSAEPFADLPRLRFVGLTFARLGSLAPFRAHAGLRYLSLLANVPSLRELAGHPSLRIVRLSAPEDGDLAPLGELPALAGLIGHDLGPHRSTVPDLTTLGAGDPLVREWRQAAQTSEPLLSL